MGLKIAFLHLERTMKWQTTLVLISFCTLVMIAGAQSSTRDQGQAQETQVRGYWVDPSTGLMWVGKDNGREVNWHKAMKFCRNLRLAGYSDWRLATLDELYWIYDKNAEAPGENPQSRWHEAEPMTFHVKGGLFLRGEQWSSTRVLDERGHPSGYAFHCDFNEGRLDRDELWFDTHKHALCVRRPSESASKIVNRPMFGCSRCGFITSN